MSAGTKRKAMKFAAGQTAQLVISTFGSVACDRRNIRFCRGTPGVADTEARWCACASKANAET